ncbi:hypothetical protein OC834_005122 [Tilletia horrida]|nr:hypothetical protein OC834_005122 [Tilletia horrida]
MSSSSSSSSPSLLRSLLRGEAWAQDGLDVKLALHLTIFLGLLLLGALQHFVLSKPPAGTRRSALGMRGQGGGGGGEKEEEGEVLATVEGLYVYPIKSCAGLRLASVQLLKKGLELDRNWAVVRTDTHSVLSLRPEPKLTLIQPAIDEARGLLTVSLSSRAQSRLQPFSIPLRPSQSELRKWKLLPELPMWGDAADGRIVEAIDSQPGDPTPAEWLTEFLGYPAALVQFDTTPSSATRTSYPIFRPPEASNDTISLEGPRGLHFADEYPLLVATVESLQALEAKIADEAAATRPAGDTKATPIAGLSPTRWLEQGGDSEGSERASGAAQQRQRLPRVDMRRFRPNVVIQGLGPDAYPPFSEDAWETLWFLPNQQPDDTTQREEGQVQHSAKLHLVARCARCLLTTVDPVSAERDPAVPLRLLARDGWRMRVKATTGDGVGGERARGKKEACFGMYACPVPVDGRPTAEEDASLPASYGHVSVGDHVRVRWRKKTEEDQDGEEEDDQLR